MNVQLIKNGVLYDTIATLPSTTETYSWTPAFSYANASNYQIKVVDASDPSIMALTPFFALADPPICYINITAPHGGEEWIKGAPQTISWSSGPACTTFSIKLLRGSSIQATIATSASAGAGSYSWTPSHALATASDYQIQIVENSDPSKTATSNAVALQDAPAAADFFTVLPCRLADTRGGPRMVSGVPWFFNAAGNGPCGIPASAKALSLNVTVVAPTNSGYVVVYPSDSGTPATSTVNFSPGANRANNAIISLGADGRIAARASIGGNGATDLVLDVNGYFDAGDSPGFIDDFELRDFSLYQIAKLGYFPETVSWSFVEEASTVLEGSGGYSSGGGESVAYLANFDQNDVSISVRLKVQEVRNAGHHSGVVARFNPDTLEFYELWVNTGSNLLILSRRIGGTQWVHLASSPLPSDLLGDWITLQFEVVGSSLRGLVNGQLLIETSDETFPLGTVGLDNAGGVTRYDDLHVEAREQGSLP